MANKHIKVINGRKYYYESIRKGSKVVSRYIGPVEERAKRRKIKEKIEEKEDVRPEDIILPEDSYIG